MSRVWDEISLFLARVAFRAEPHSPAVAGYLHSQSGRFCARAVHALDRPKAAALQRYPRGFWIGPMHCSVQRARAVWRTFDSPFLEVDWMPVDQGCGGDGSGRTLRFRTRSGYVRFQFGGNQPWRRSV